MELPDLILLEVFSLVSVRERYLTLRLVCHRWKQLAEHQLKAEGTLVVYEEEEDRPFHRRWLSDNRRLSCLEIQPFFNLLLANCHYRWLKKLCLYRVDEANFERAGLMEKLADCLSQLEELSIDRTQLIWPDIRYKNINLQGLTFPNLRALSVKQKLDGKVSITAPRLEKLVVWAICYMNVPKTLIIDVSHPERLKYLQCDSINVETRKFANLEHLICQNVRSDFDLSHFPKLRRLDLCLNLDSFFDQPFLPRIESLLKQKKQLKLDQLEITHFGVRDLDLKWGFVYSDIPFEKCRFLFHKRNIELLLGNYSNFTVDQLPWLGLIYYPIELQCHKHLVSCCSKINTQAVVVDQDHSKIPPDPALLIRFLVDIGGVRSLTINNCSFRQEFYDQLKTVPFIGDLALAEGALLPTNFDFICDIKFLYRVDFLESDSNQIRVDSLQENLKKSKIRDFSIFTGFFGIFRSMKHNLKGFKHRIKVRINGRDIETDCIDTAFGFWKEMKMCRESFLV